VSVEREGSRQESGQESRDALLERIVSAFEGINARVSRLERALADNVELASELAELRAEHEVARQDQEEVNALFAQHLGGVLVKVEPPSPFPLLVVDNTRPAGNDNPSPSPEGGA
jgi:hypothetical protein